MGVCTKYCDYISGEYNVDSLIELTKLKRLYKIVYLSEPNEVFYKE